MVCPLQAGDQEEQDQVKLVKLFGWMLDRLYKELQSFGNTFTLIFIRTLAERKWHRYVVVSLSPGENGREHLEEFLSLRRPVSGGRALIRTGDGS